MNVFLSLAQNQFLTETNSVPASISIPLGTLSELFDNSFEYVKDDIRIFLSETPCVFGKAANHS